jgi:hypothetical protein
MVKWNKRFHKVSEVPIVSFAVVPADHPDLELIKKAYYAAGVGLGVDHSNFYQWR